MSGQVGRNDPCPCGSGKKYKKCCMLKNAVSITALLEKDAAALHNRIIDYAVTSYSEELTKDFQEKVEYLIIKDRKKELEFYILAHSIWFIFFKPLEDGTTIMERFIREKGHTIRRPRLQEIAATWTNARAVAGPVLSAGDNYLRLRDALTEEEMEIKLLRPMKVADSAYAIAIVVPFGDEKIFFWEPFDYKSPLKGYEEEFLQKGFAESEYDDPKEFLAQEFLLIMNQLPIHSVKLGAENFEWEKPVHKETAELLEKGLADYEDAYEAKLVAFSLWNSYCQKQPETKRLPKTCAAAIHYILFDIDPERKITKKEVAEKYDVSVSALTTACNEMKEVLAEDIERILADLEADRAAEREAAAAKGKN